MNNARVILVVLTTCMALGSKIKAIKEPTAQLVIMYRHCPSEPERAALRLKAGVHLRMEYNRTPN